MPRRVQMPVCARLEARIRVVLPHPEVASSNRSIGRVCRPAGLAATHTMTVAEFPWLAVKPEANFPAEAASRVHLASVDGKPFIRLFRLPHFSRCLLSIDTLGDE